MIRYPKLTPQQATRQMLDAFGGYNHNLRIPEDEFFDMKNLTSDFYPAISPRQPRSIYAESVNALGLISKDSLCHVNGSAIVINGKTIEMELSDTPKQLISMGAYIIIMPDKKYINTIDTTDRGAIEASITTTEAIDFRYCHEDGSEKAIYVSDTPPDDTTVLWIDTSVYPHAYKNYSNSSKMWIATEDNFVKITYPEINTIFDVGQSISIIDAMAFNYDHTKAMVTGNGINEDNVGYIIIKANIIAEYSQVVPAVTIQRNMPNMDFIVEAGNRLWGCRYGRSIDGNFVNEVYASKLGDFKSWYCFNGISTDSWVGSCGTDGPFTGAVTHLGNPLFFKENGLHKIYISSSGAHQMQNTICPGVQKGSEKSLAIVGSTLFYKSGNGVYAYDGSLPVSVSEKLGNLAYRNAVAGAFGKKYYISMQGLDENWNLFVFDTEKAMWHKEDSLHAICFCSFDNGIYCIDNNHNILNLNSPDASGNTPVEWMAETGEIGINMPDMKYISKLTIRLSLALGSTLDIFIQYDSEGEWIFEGTINGTSLRSFYIPIRPRRCDHCKIKLKGIGDAKLFSITKTIEQGSDVSC